MLKVQKLYLRYPEKVMFVEKEALSAVISR